MLDAFLDPIFDHWSRMNRKPIQKQLREAPLFTELGTRLYIFAFAALCLQFALLWWEGVRSWSAQAGLGFGYLTAFPAVFLVLGVLAHTKRKPFAYVGLVTGFAMTVITPAAAASFGAFEFPQFQAALMLTILLAGLLVGKSFVRVWTLACVAIQFGNMPNSGPTPHTWRVNALSGVFLLAVGWLVDLVSWHVERLNLTARAAEEQQRAAIVAERTRFAREIHDTLAQGFTGIMMQLNAAEQRLGDAEDARGHIDNARRLAKESLEEARRSVTALRPNALAQGSLLEAIEQIARQLTSDSSVQFDSKLEGQPYALPEQSEASLLRIAQEALTNSVRHSGAKRITLSLAYRTGSVTLEIGDSGRGMTGTEPSGFGLEGMRERAREIGGEIRVLSDPGRGTRIVVTIPNA